MANTTWSTTDKTASVTLSNANLTATVSSGVNQGVRASDRQVTGKFYFEVTATTWTGVQGIIGIANSGAILSSIAATPTGAVVILQSSGNIFLNGVSTGVTLGARANGNIIGVAVDLNTYQIWFRAAPVGNWNGSATFAPDGLGGIGFHSIGGDGLPVHPLVACTSATLVVTANFGDSAFSGTPPSGYTSGFTAGATIGTNALATQVAAEQWITTNPPAQITQVAVEEWATVQNAPPNVYTGVLSGSRAGVGSAVVSSTPALITPNLVGIGVVGLPLAILPSARVTQVALEEWAAVAPAVPVEAWVTQVSLEEWASIGPTFEYAKAGGLEREALLTATARVYAAGLARETLLTMVPGQSQVRVGALVREALVSGVIVPRQYAVPVS